jgi:hypothetical protein
MIVVRMGQPPTRNLPPPALMQAASVSPLMWTIAAVPDG